MKKLTYILIFLTIGAFMNNCSDDQEFTKNLNFVSFEFTPTELGVDIDGSTIHTIKVYTTQIHGTNRTFNVIVDEATTAEAASFSLPETVTVPANSNEGSIQVVLNDVNIGDGKVLALKFEEQEGVYLGGTAQFNIRQICNKNEVSLDITFDGFASECSWVLLDSASETIASGGGYSDGDETFSTSFCLDDGTYTFIVYDDFGDGLSYPTDGSIILSKDGTVLYSVEGDFGSGASSTFDVSK